MNETEKRQLFGEPQRRRVALVEIRREDGAQVREELNTAATLAYADAYREGEELPPIVLFDDHGRYRMADGFHRYVGAGAAGLLDLDADIYEGDLRKARLYATAANAQHGVRRTPETIARAVQVLLDDPEWRAWSDRQIGRHVGCSHTTVSRRRAELEAAEAAAAGKGQQQGLFDEPSPAAPPKIRKDAKGREIDVSKIGKSKEEKRIAEAIAEAERLGTIEAADSEPSSRRELPRAIKQSTGIDVPEHAQADLYSAYLAARDRELEQRQRAAELAAASAAAAQPQPEAPQTYRPILGGAEGKALQDRPLATPAIGDLIRQEAQRLEATYQPRIAELESTLKATEERLHREERASVAVLSAVTRLASTWKGQHDGPRAQLLEALEVAENAQALTEQWDRALRRAAESGRQESAAQVADLQRQLGAAKEDARLLRLQVQELEQDAALRRQRSRQVLCEEPDCTRYVDPPPGGGLALCDHHRPGAPLRPWREVYPLSASAPEILETAQSWGDLGDALVECVEGWGGDLGADLETLCSGAIERALDVEDVALRADLRSAELAALLRGAETALVALRSLKEDWRDSCLVTAPEGGPRGFRYCTRDLGHDGRHSYTSPHDDDVRRIEQVLADRRQTPAPAAPKGRQARAPKAEPAPAPAAPQAQADPPPAPAAPTWTPASVGGAAAVHAVTSLARLGEEELHAWPAALCGQRPNYRSKGWTHRPSTGLTCKGCQAAVSRG